MGHLLLVVEVDLDALEPLDLAHGVGHRGLHPDPEHVELEQAEVLDVVLVELAHREPRERCLHRGAVEQRGVGEQHPARVHRHVPRQAVEALDELEHQVQPLLPQPAGAQLGQLAQRGAGIARADVREGLGDRVGLQRRHAQGGADVAHGVPHAVGVHHRHAHAALAAVAVEDRLVDLGAARGLHVDVDVGQRLAQRGEEALHQQLVADRVDPGDAEQVGHQAARARAAGRDPDPEVLDQVGDVADGEEVRRVAEVADHPELVVEALPHHRQAAAAVAAADRPLAAGTQRRVGVGVVGGEGELREVHLPQAEVAAGVEGAALGQRAGAGQQPRGVGGSATGGVRHLVGDLAHLRPGLQVPLGVGAVDVAPVQGDQPTGGVEHVGRGGVAALGVAHLVGQHRGQTDLGGHPGQVGGAGSGAGQPVVDQLDLQAAGRHQGAPAGQLGADQVVAAPLQRRPEERARAEQDDHVAGAEQRGDLGALRVEHGRAPLAGEVGGREDPAHRGPAAAAAPGAGRVREEGHPRKARVAEGTSAHRRTTAAAGLPGRAAARCAR